MSSEPLSMKVLKFLNEYPGATIKDVAQGLNISTGLARAVLYRLKNKGLIEKAGQGYVLTVSGEKMLGKHKEKESKTVEETVSQKKEIISREAPRETPILQQQPSQQAIESPRLDELEELLSRINRIEKDIAGLEQTIKALKKELSIIRKEIETRLSKPKTGHGKGKRLDRLPKPIMSFIEAQQVLGDDIRVMIYTGKAIPIGSLVVDSDYYNEFISRFPLSRREADKLSEQEKILLEELKKEGRIYLYAGKEYRLV